ncbi:MAG: hypothetical protein MH252_09640 [Thermosynechococcaceae cyanobacterium MS004]|nr:hypothetical protein [Thermosynechococcaceae cyanobacterium MS004]
MSYYLVATYSNQEQAKTAYQQLQTSDLPLSQVDLFGAGYKSIQEATLVDPNQQAWRQAMRMLWWVIPFGFAAGFGFNDITKLSILPQSSPFLNHLLGGLLGAGSAAMGGFTFGGGAQVLLDREKTPLEKRLKAGKYLVVAEGTELLVRQANRALQGIPSDSLQFYESQPQRT